VQQYIDCRIATQALIESTGNALGSLPVEERSCEILKMHTDPDYVDRRIDDLLESKHQHAVVTDIRKGKLGYTQTDAIGHYDLHPITRGCLHSIASYPQAISKLQDEVRNVADNKNLILDIRDTKPPEFQIDVYDTKRTLPPVYNWSETARGILDDSIRDLTVYIYLPDNADLRIGTDEIVEAVRKVGLWASLDSLQESSPNPKDIIILVMDAVFQDANSTMLLEIISRPQSYG
jgi:hypothetical protein